MVVHTVALGQLGAGASGPNIMDSGWSLIKKKTLVRPAGQNIAASVTLKFQCKIVMAEGGRHNGQSTLC